MVGPAWEDPAQIHTFFLEKNIPPNCCRKYKSRKSYLFVNWNQTSLEQAEFDLTWAAELTLE